jgi:hypothetical protein
MKICLNMMVITTFIYFDIFLLGDDIVSTIMSFFPIKRLVSIYEDVCLFNSD